jgi:hypothetical protein
MLAQRQPYWFHAKRYGWGWGLPARWQGWAVLVTWFVIVVAASPFLALRNTVLFFVFLLVMVAVLIAICYAKGEPPHWRWGPPRPGHCPSCGYDLRATPDRCPECGAEPEPAPAIGRR